MNKVYKIINKYKEKFGMKRNQLEFIDEKFKEYKKFNNKERKKLEEKTKKVKEYREFLDKNKVKDIFKMIVRSGNLSVVVRLLD